MVGGSLRLLSTTKTGRHDIAEILLKVALSNKNQIKSKRNGCDPMNRFNPVTFVLPIPRQGLEFERYMSVYFCVQLLVVRGGCSLC